MRVGIGGRGEGDSEGVKARVRVRVTLSVWSVWRHPTPSYELVPVSKGEGEGEE